MVFTTHVEMKTRSSYLGEILGVKISSVWTLPKQGDLVFILRGSRERNKIDNFHQFIALEVGQI